MSNLRIIHDNAADRATTISASTTAGGLVAANMQSDRKGQVHRSTGTSVTYTLTWTDGESVGGVALPASNLTADATVQVRLYSDTACTALVADSGALYACPGLDLGLWDWTLPLNANAFAFGGASKSAVWFAEHAFAKGCKIDLVDAGNPAGYIDCARLVVGAWWSPEVNAQAGTQVTIVDTSTGGRNDADDALPERRPQHDAMSLDLTLMPETDRTRLLQIIRNVGLARNLFLSLRPGVGNTVPEQNGTIFGHRAANSAVSFDRGVTYTNKIELEGW